MARKSRLHYPGALYHVILRGNARQDILESAGLAKVPGYSAGLKMIMLIISTILLLLIFVAVLATAAILLLSQNESKGKKSEIIRTALVRLLKRPYGAFVIIEEPSTGKYIQFSGSSEEPLYFDLPQQTLTLEEFEKARNLFSELGYPGPETYEVYEYSGGPAVGTQTSFYVSFGNDIEKATELSIHVLEKVYGFENSVKLKLTEK